MDYDLDNSLGYSFFEINVTALLWVLEHFQSLGKHLDILNLQLWWETCS